jgi:hypothetical protein
MARVAVIVVADKELLDDARLSSPDGAARVCPLPASHTQRRDKGALLTREESTMLDVIINGSSIRIGPRFAVSFHRTLRLPDDGRTYPLPPGLGRFPILTLNAQLPQHTSTDYQGAQAIIPMYQREALWLGFNAASWKPNAVKIAIGRVNAISGAAMDNILRADPQDYIVCPDQPWLDGINAGHGAIRQFVAMPLGLGYTVEAAITEGEKFGGIQITVFEPAPGRFPDEPPPQAVTSPMSAPHRVAQPMGLGAGGVMRQKIYPDPYGIDAWDQDNYGSVDVHIVNSLQFRELTGHEPPPTPIDAKIYTEHGLPWFELYDETKGDLAPSDRLSTAKTISARDQERGETTPEAGSFEVSETQVKKLTQEEEGSRTDRSS